MSGDEVQIPSRDALHSSRSSGRMCVLWGVALGLLLLLGLVCWKVVVPVWQTSIVLEQVKGCDDAVAAVEELGGPRQALDRLAAYLRMPSWIARRKQSAAFVMSFCGDGAIDVMAEAMKSAENDFTAAHIILSMLDPDLNARNRPRLPPGWQPDRKPEPRGEALRRFEEAWKKAGLK